MIDPSTAYQPAGGDPPRQREIRFRHSTDFPEFLRHYRLSLLVSTYQAGKLAVIHAGDDGLAQDFLNFEQAMGIAYSPRRLAVGARSQIWLLDAAPDIAASLQPVGQVDACYLTLRSHVTGEIQGHEIAWIGDELWVVNTLFSCLCTVEAQFSFMPRWKPKFITALSAEDRCHLNGMALEDGRVKYVTAHGDSDVAAGWRAGKNNGGVLIDVASGEAVISGLCMPHSPRVHQQQLYVLDSGRGMLAVADIAAGRLEPVAALPGYTRGLAMFGPYAFVGLSKIRETATFGGVPIAEKGDTLKCGVWVVDCRSGQTAVFLEFETGVDEIFDLQLMRGIRHPVLRGPYAAADGHQPIWTAGQLR